MTQTDESANRLRQEQLDSKLELRKLRNRLAAETERWDRARKRLRQCDEA